LARAAIAALLRAGRQMRDQGSFGWTADVAAGADIKKLLAPWNS